MVDDPDFEAARAAFLGKVERFLVSASPEAVDRLAIASMRCLYGEPISGFDDLAEGISRFYGRKTSPLMIDACAACFQTDAISPRVAALLAGELAVRGEPGSNLDRFTIEHPKDAGWLLQFEDELALWNRPPMDERFGHERVRRIFALPAGRILLDEAMNEDLFPDEPTPETLGLLRAGVESPNPLARSRMASPAYALPPDLARPLFQDECRMVRISAVRCQLERFSHAVEPLEFARTLLRCAVDVEPLVAEHAIELVTGSECVTDRTALLLAEEIKRQDLAVPHEFQSRLAERLEKMTLSMHERLDTIVGAYPSLSEEKGIDTRPVCAHLDSAGPDAPLLAGFKRLDREPVNPLSRASSKAKEGPER